MKKTLATVVAMAIAIGGFAGQVYYDTASGERDLAQGSAWVGGSLPTTDDVAVLAGAGGEFTLGAPVEWKGLVYSNLTATVTLRPSNNATLTLGAGGVTPGGKVSPKQAIAFYVPVILACDQEWYALDEWHAPIAIYGGVSGKGGANYKLTLRNYANEATSWYGIRSRIDADLGAHGTTMNIQDGGDVKAEVLGTVDTGWKHVLNVFNADKGETAFTNIFRAGEIVNDGKVSFGVNDNGTHVRGDILFQDGDRIVGNETLTAATAVDSEDPQIGEIYQHLGKFHMTGGTVSNNVFTLRAGDYVQEGGRVWLRYALGGAYSQASSGQRFLVNGANASLDADAIRLGGTNGEMMQNWMIISNGIVTARNVVRLTDEVAGIGANALLSVAGGTLKAGGISVGNAKATGISTNAVARLEVTGGELAVGANGFTVATNVWNKGQADDAQLASWYRMRFAGGTLRAYETSESDAALAFEGDREIAVDSGVKMVHHGRLSGPASLTKTGAGTLVLPPTCAWTGATTVAAGTLVTGLKKAKTPYIVFRADDLALADGATVESWKANASDGFHVNEFTKGTTSAVGIGACPTFKTNRINGHAAVTFNGTNQGFAMTGGTAGTSNSAPLNDATNFTVAVAFRATKGVGDSGAGQAALNAAGIAGQYFQPGNNRWLMGMASDGVLVGGVIAGAASGAGTPCSLWSNAGGQIDENVHVAIFNWTAKGKMRVGVDGTWTESTDISGMTKVSVNRFLLGVQESYSSSSRTFKYFGGEIAEVRIYRNDQLTPDEIDAAGFEMAMTYGVDYRLRNVSADPAAVQGASAQVPSATGVWCADDLTQAAGESVTVWKDRTDNAGEFNTTVGTAIISGTTAPTISSETMNGHKAVAFDGVKNMLGMTGLKGGTYIGNGANFTVALVLRPKNAGGEIRGPWTTCAGVMGQAYSGSNDQNKWVVGVSGANLHVPGEQMLMGIRDGSSGTIAHHGTPRDMLDGRAHVVICTFGNDLTMNVDGIRATRKNATTKARQVDARTTLGRIEDIVSGSTRYNGRYFKGDIAEIRFFADKALSVAEQNALGRELALKYGIDAGGFYAPGESVFLSRRVTVNAGATVCGVGDGFRLADGMALEGAGKVCGLLVVGAGGVLDASDENAVDFSKATVAFETGSVVKPGVNGSATVPVALGTVVWPTSGGVVVDLASLPQATGKVLTWTDGEAPDVSRWQVVGRKGKLTVGKDGKCVKLSAGFMVIVR